MLALQDALDDVTHGEGVKTHETTRGRTRWSSETGVGMHADGVAQIGYTLAPSTRDALRVTPTARWSTRCSNAGAFAGSWPHSTKTRLRARRRASASPTRASHGIELIRGEWLTNALRVDAATIEVTARGHQDPIVRCEDSATARRAVGANQTTVPGVVSPVRSFAAHATTEIVDGAQLAVFIAASAVGRRVGLS